MFSFFQRKTKNVDQELAALSKMLTGDTLGAMYRRELLDRERLDYSVDSLKHLDDYLEAIRKDKFTDQELLTITLRCGAYVGEVIKRNSQYPYHWLDFETACTLDNKLIQVGKSMGTATVLCAKKGQISFPLGKVLKFIQNGREDSVHFFASVFIHGLPKSLFARQR